MNTENEKLPYEVPRVTQMSVEIAELRKEVARLQSDLAASQEIARERYETILGLKRQLDEARTTE